MLFSKKINPPPLPRAEIILKNRNFCYNVKPIHVYSRIFGLIPYSIVVSNVGPVQAKVRLFDFCWFIISICFYLFLIIPYSKIVQVPQNPNESSILVLGDTILICFGLVFGAIIVIIDMFNRFRIVDILSKFMLFDKKVRKT